MALPPLYKYLDVLGTKLTLGNRTFKHAKPSDFNDTEDLTIQSVFSESVEAALTKIADCFTDVIVKNVNEPPTCGTRWKDKVALIQHIYRENPAAADTVREEMKKFPASKIYDVDHMRAITQEFVEEINKYMQEYRVLCVTTHRNSERMWEKYAQSHQGSVLRIQPSIEKDSKFQLFRRVEYRESRPPLYDETLDFLAGSLFGDQEKRIRAVLEKIVYAKTLEWEHESEYRLAIPLRQGEEWDILPYHSEEITELYLGLSMTNENKEETINEATAINPSIAIFQTSRDANQALIFQPISR